jgi:hypothetical protein
MRSPNAGPKWWQVYLTFPLLIALFILDHQLKISPREHQVLQIGIVLVVYGLISWWIKANSRAISRMDQQYYGKFRVVQIPPSQIIEASNERHPMLQLPDSELKGMLSDTFEMDCPDVDDLSIDDISQEIKKE